VSNHAKNRIVMTDSIPNMTLVILTVSNQYFALKNAKKE
jgi:hypothetical protein